MTKEEFKETVNKGMRLCFEYTERKSEMKKVKLMMTANKERR